MSNRTIDGSYPGHTGSIGRTRIKKANRMHSISQESSRSRNSSVSSRKRADSRSLRDRPIRKRPTDLAISIIASPTRQDDDIIPYNLVLPVLSENFEEIQPGLTNEIIQSDPKRAVGFEPESPRSSVLDDPPILDRDATKIDVRLNSSDRFSAIDVCASPLCLDAANGAIDEVSAVCERLHYSSISTILLSRVIKDHYRERKEAGNEKSKRTSITFRIDQIKIGLLQISNNETIFLPGMPQRNNPCTTFVIGWLEHVDVGVDVKPGHEKISFKAAFRRLHLQLGSKMLE